MNEHEYQMFVLSKISDRAKEDPLVNAALGLVGESGEIADLVKKVVFHNHPPKLERFREEMGDLVFYLTFLMYATGLSWAEVIEDNVKKLNERYPEGFDSERSMNRGS
jgi:NTP pyrophosphatase (non-canonical NTP hydrolase)